MSFSLIVGLGNPGSDYSATRHNAGFGVVDKIANRCGCSFAESRRFKAMVAKDVGNALLLAKPLTYMNLSGFAVCSIVSYFKISLDDLLIISDDLDLQIGKIRFQNGGASAGHKGVESIIAQLGSREFVRLRIGIGRSEENAASYVLKRLKKDELELFDNIFDKAAEAALYWYKYRFDKAANRYNGDALITL
ncbi:MAG: peptidyl-tRNA hydrolase [bacterium]|nr:MAG: peptidyl-tRNA hydrolase [bacterium]